MATLRSCWPLALSCSTSNLTVGLDLFVAMDTLTTTANGEPWKMRPQLHRTAARQSLN